MVTANQFLNRYEPYRKPWEIGFWIVYFLINAMANSLTVIQDVQRAGLAVASWEAIVWESSSALGALMLIWPIVYLTRRFPLQWHGFEQLLLIHLLGSVGYAIAHVVLMVAFREAAYAWMGGNYSFGHWPSELVYEYLKDARSYAGLVLMIEGYRFVLRRLRGEARWPDPAGPEFEPVNELPERFLVKMLGREFLVPADRIEYVSAAGNYVNLHVAGRDYPLRSTMKSVLTKLDQDLFQRVHRSYAIQLEQLVEIRPGEHGDASLVLRNGNVLPCSKGYRSVLKERLQNSTT